MNINKTEVRNRIFSIRKSLGLTMEQFAELLETSKGAVSNWENNRNLPNNERLKKIAELGEMSVDELLGTEENQMTYNVNGINYNEKMITDEELAVVEAMRSEGGSIFLFVDLEYEKDAMSYIESFPNKIDYSTHCHEDSPLITAMTDNRTSVYARYKKVTPPASNE